jgi:hypothetical protein
MIWNGNSAMPPLLVSPASNQISVVTRPISQTSRRVTAIVIRLSL